MIVAAATAVYTDKEHSMQINCTALKSKETWTTFNCIPS
jgi:hypothetical protein